MFASNIALDGSNGTNTTNVWFAKPDGSGLTPLTRLVHADINFPIWSPDGTEIAYISDRALDGSDALNSFTVAITGGTTVAVGNNIWVMNADGSGARPLTRFRFASCGFNVFNGIVCLLPLNFDSVRNPFGPFPAVWSPDGSKLAFASWQALDGSPNVLSISEGPNIWVANTDGSGAVPVTRSINTFAEFPAWLPDGSGIASASATGFSVIHPDASAATPLINLPPGSLLACCDQLFWSPDGKKIAFDSKQALDGSQALNSNLNIWTVNADGSGLTPLTRFTAVDALRPTWSPDSARIAFLAQLALDGSNAVGPTTNIWMINADGSHLTPVTKLTHAHEGEPVWSPDGAQLAFSSPRALDGSDADLINNTFNLWVVNVDGSGAAPFTKVTAPFADSSGPKWRPR